MAVALCLPIVFDAALEQIPLAFSLNWLRISVGWSMMALVLALLKILAMIVLEIKELVPVIGQLFAPVPEILKLVREKEADDSLSGYLLEQLAESKEALIEALGLIDDDVVASIVTAVDSLEQCLVSYRRERRDATKRWLATKGTERGLLALAAENNELNKIIAPVDALKLEATNKATQVRAGTNSRTPA